MDQESPNNKRAEKRIHDDTSPQSQPPAPKKQKVLNAENPMNVVTSGTFLPPLDPSSSNNPNIPNHPKKVKETPWKIITKDIPDVLQSTTDSSKLDFNISSGFNTSITDLSASEESSTN